MPRAVETSETTVVGPQGALTSSRVNMVCPTLKPCLQLWYVMSRYPLRTVYIQRVRVCTRKVMKQIELLLFKNIFGQNHHKLEVSEQFKHVCGLLLDIVHLSLS